MIRELLVALGVAAVMALLQTLVAFDPEAVTDWRVWLISLGASGVRAGAQAGLTVLARRAAAQGGG